MRTKNILKNVIRVILVIAIIFWMMVIFGFSSADGEESQSTSDKITGIVIDYMYGDYEEMSLEEQRELWNNVSFLVRKTGHFGEYAILAVLLTTLLITFHTIRTNKKYILSVVLFCALYAVSDEVHQTFVDGRSPKVFDVCIDTAGAFCGMVFVWGISTIAYYFSARKISIGLNAEE